jgi:nucleoside-diphosphate-sugar epimerase
MKPIHSIVTGGAGFVGSHLCDFLLAQGHKVTCVDNLITGKKENIAHLRANRNFKFKKHNVIKPLPIRFSQVDYIFHLASPASPIGYMTHSIETILVNSMGSLQLLEYCRKRKTKFLFASTSEVYGSPLVHPQTETYWGNVNSFGPRSCYDESKRLGEALVYEYINKFKVDARIIRIFNTYGPRLNENDGRVVSNLITQCLRGKPVTLYGDGSQTRSFCFVSDLVAGIWAAISRENTMGEIFNLGNPQETTIRDFAKLVIELCGTTESKMNHKPLPVDDPVRRKPDISKAKRVLGWEPRIPLREGLRQTIDWYRDRI